MQAEKGRQASSCAGPRKVGKLACRHLQQLLAVAMSLAESLSAHHTNPPAWQRSSQASGPPPKDPFLTAPLTFAHLLLLLLLPAAPSGIDFCSESRDRPC